MNLLHMTMKRITSAHVKLIRLALTTCVTIIKFIIKKLQKHNYKKITKKVTRLACVYSVFNPAIYSYFEFLASVFNDLVSIKTLPHILNSFVLFTSGMVVSLRKLWFISVYFFYPVHAI